jgi:hypothetical protein
MTESDYQALIRDGFFIRDGKSIDSGGALNTTDEYQKIKHVQGRRELM